MTSMRSNAVPVTGTATDFAEDRDGDDVGDEFDRAEGLERRRHLQAENEPHGGRHQRDDDDAAHADAHDLRDDRRAPEANLAIGE